MKELRTLVLISILVLIFIPLSDGADHNSAYCFNNCHGSLGFSINNDEECGNCHYLMERISPNFSEYHAPKTCPVCHGITSKETFHPVHTNTSCITCHIDNTLPEANYSECLSCHISGLHSTHLEKSCDICHVDTSIQKISNPKTITVCDEFDDYNCWEEEVITWNTNETKSINTSKPITNYKKLTIYEILVNLIKAIRDDIYE